MRVPTPMRMGMAVIMTMALAATAGERLPNRPAPSTAMSAPEAIVSHPIRVSGQEQLPRHEHEDAEQQHTGGVGEGDGQAQGAAWRIVPPEPTR